jgi:hypothetical protein
MLHSNFCTVSALLAKCKSPIACYKMATNTTLQSKRVEKCLEAMSDTLL